MTVRRAKSLDVLVSEINKRWPTRKKDSDGWIGDASHQSRSSDHNAWIVVGPDRVVSAQDITHDPASGCDSYMLAEALKGTRDKRIKYIISNRKICSSVSAPWTWRTYNGANPHDHHIHVSVFDDVALLDGEEPWHVADLVLGKSIPEQQPPPVRPTLRHGAKGDDVKAAQEALNAHGADLALDSGFGDKTEKAVREFQAHSGLPVDGKVGPLTWKALT